jgi:hypothetical protein
MGKKGRERKRKRTAIIHTARKHDGGVDKKEEKGRGRWKGEPANSQKFYTSH